MNYHLRSNTRRTGFSRTGKVLFVFIVFAAVLFGGNYISGGTLANLIRVPAASVLGSQGLFREQLEHITYFFTSKEALQQERDVLQARVQELEVYALNNIVLSSENAELRRLLGNDGATLNNGILARVVSYGGVFPYGTILISRDAATDFTIGARVHGPNNTLIGTVVSLGEGTAMVQLLSAPGQETLALAGADERVTPITLRGIGSGNMTARVARDADIRVGDVVTRAGEEGSLIGFVGLIETKPSDAFQQVYVRVPLNINTVRFVRVQ